MSVRHVCQLMSGWRAVSFHRALSSDWPVAVVPVPLGVVQSQVSVVRGAKSVFSKGRKVHFSVCQSHSAQRIFVRTLSGMGAFLL